MASHAGTILNQLYDQYVRGIDCDVIFRASDHMKQKNDAQTSSVAGTSAEDDIAWISLHCHRNVIRAASSFFDRIFSKKYSEESSEVEEGIEAMLDVKDSEKRHVLQLTFHEISSHSIHALVEFAYTGFVKVETNVLKKVVEDLKLMNMQSMLDELSSRFNDDLLSCSNSIFYLIVSFSLQKDEMYRRVLSFILDEFSRGLKRDKSFEETWKSIIEMQLSSYETNQKILSELKKEAEVIEKLGLNEDYLLILILIKLIETICISEEDESKLLHFLITKRREKCHIHLQPIALFCHTDCEELCVQCLFKNHAKHHVEPVDALKFSQLARFWGKTDLEFEDIKQSSKDRNFALNELGKVISTEKLRNMSIQDSCAKIKPKMDKLSDIFESEKIAANDADVMDFEQFIAAMEKETRCLKEEYEKAKKLSDELLNLMHKRVSSCASIADAGMELETLENLEEIDVALPLNASNCISILKRAKKIENGEAYGRAFEFIIENFMSVVSKSGTRFHRRIGPNVFEDLLKSDKLKVQSEDDVIVVVKEWIHFDIRQRKQFAAKLLTQVRFGELSKEMLDKLDCDPSFLLILNEESKQLLNDAVSGKCSRNPRPSTITNLVAFGDGGNNLFYDSVNCTWEKWKSQDSISRFGAVNVSKNVFIIGGADESNERQSKVSIYNVETKTWKSGPSLQQPRSEFATCVDSENTVYVIGGRFSGDLNAENSVELLKCDRNGEPIGDWQTLPSMINKRFDFEAAVIDDKIYAIGGFVGGYTIGELMENVEAFHPKLNAWKKCCPMSCARDNHAVVPYKNEIYVFGKDGVCEKYNPVTDTWTDIRSYRNGASFRGSAVLNGKIYLVGGTECQETDIYDPKTDMWSKGPQIPQALNRVKCVTWR